MPELENIEIKGQVVGKVGDCQIIVSLDDKDKKHFEATCASKEARDELVAIFEEEAILRINPKVILDDMPPAEPKAELVTES